MLADLITPMSGGLAAVIELSLGWLGNIDDIELWKGESNQKGVYSHVSFLQSTVWSLGKYLSCMVTQQKSVVSTCLDLVSTLVAG